MKERREQRLEKDYQWVRVSKSTDNEMGKRELIFIVYNWASKVKLSISPFY